MRVPAGTLRRRQEQRSAHPPVGARAGATAPCTRGGAREQRPCGRRQGVPRAGWRLMWSAPRPETGWSSRAWSPAWSGPEPSSWSRSSPPGPSTTGSAAARATPSSGWWSSCWPGPRPGGRARAAALRGLPHRTAGRDRLRLRLFTPAPEPDTSRFTTSPRPASSWPAPTPTSSRSTPRWCSSR